MATAWEIKEYGHSVYNIIKEHDDDEILEFIEDYPIIKDYFLNFHGYKDEAEKYGIVEAMFDHIDLFDGLYIEPDGGDLYDLDRAELRPWTMHRTGTEYVCQLTEEEQRIVRMVITGYVYTELTDYSDEEKREVIENAMNERLVNIVDAEVVGDTLRAMGIL